MNRQVRRPASEYSQISYEIGGKLMERRKNAGLSRKRASELCGIKKGTIDSIESYRQDMTLTVTLEKLDNLYKSMGQ